MSGRKWGPGRQTPRVRDGRVQKKHRWDYYYNEYDVPAGGQPIPIFHEQAIRGMRHVLTEEDIRTFIGIIPDWPECSIGLKCIVLANGESDCLGWHDEGLIGLNPWSSELEELWPKPFAEEHREILRRLMIPTVEEGEDVRCKFTKQTAAGFLLMHVFLHELGHHHDRMKTKRRRHSPRGESFAEQFVNELADRMWTDFFREFGL
jgi:hypothetical protein